jgi:propanediol utilization protein
MAENIALVISIDPLAPFKVSDDLVLEFVNVTTLVRNDPENAAFGTCRVEIIEPHNLIKNQPPGGYILADRHVQMTCAKSAKVQLGQEIKFRVVP